MTTTKHTPGPWDICRVNVLMIYADNGLRIADCQCDDQPDMPEEQEEANAVLIAAAPEMLDALDMCAEVLAELARLDDGTPSVSALSMARAAIAKAKGGAA